MLNNVTLKHRNTLTMHCNVIMYVTMLNNVTIIIKRCTFALVTISLWSLEKTGGRGLPDTWDNNCDTCDTCDTCYTCYTCDNLWEHLWQPVTTCDTCYTFDNLWQTVAPETTVTTWNNICDNCDNTRDNLWHMWQSVTPVTTFVTNVTTCDTCDNACDNLWQLVTPVVTCDIWDNI